MGDGTSENTIEKIVRLKDENHKLRAENERLRAIESAAKDVKTAVSATGDHTQWFKSLGALMTVLSVNQQITSGISSSE